MSNPVANEVRAVVRTRMEAVSPDRIEQLTAREYHPCEHVLPLLPTASAGLATILVAILVVVLSLSSNTPVAFAGWTATPAVASVSVVTAARRACGHVPASDILASEARGPYTAIVFVSAGKPRQCVVEGNRVLLEASTRYRVHAYASVPADKAMLPMITQKTFGKTTAQLNHLQNRYQTVASDSDGSYAQPNALLADINATLTGPNSMSAALGTVGTDVTGVTFILKDGNHIHATVKNGWYVAWWPGATRPGGGEPERVAVTSTSGTRSAALPPPARLGTYRTPRGCVIGASCSPLVPIEAAPVIARRLARAFAMFHQTPAANESKAPAIVRSMLQRWNALSQPRGTYLSDAISMRTGNSLGLDPAQKRSPRLGPKITFWFMPGSQGSCQARAQAGSGGGGCGPADTPLRYGVIDDPGLMTVHGVQRYVIGGWVPNGNRTIKIVLASGATKEVPVKHNAFVAYLTSGPVRLIFKNGFGKTTNEPAPAANEV
jgi:hypothetical protein